MTSEELKERTYRLAAGIVALTNRLPRTRTAEVIAGQLVRSGTSVAANYRAACRARSRREFPAKLGIVEEEADETELWLRLLADAKLVDPESIAPILTETNELTAIVVRSIRTARSRLLLRSGTR